ncbi:hypothetical protein [Qingrenia yutianensis]|uniref:Uncharacterized protein n=1 Tax=Qingrenia yutianensis TaxID=2763676 RepID=A0A926IUN6_9FIRM|nr:hypothetical protein [Qingrenia yutianensis]MBC8597028.1 hypothetical protein [Qingrenia yutianensis]
MKKKFLRYFSIFMCEAYFVSLFLPIQLIIAGKTVLGMNFLFIPLMGGEIPQTFAFSLLMAVVPLFALFSSLAKRPTQWTVYLSFVLFFLLGAFFVFSLVYGFGNGFGLAVCAAESAMLCILCAAKILSYDGEDDIKAENEKIVNDFLMNNQVKERPQNAVKTEKCPYCGRTLYGGEQCDCALKTAGKR